ncbi:MAG: YkgJ family cysteine cluster protein [Lachnospiraceae bacterium]|nr:YkgJ family cysteine cluster protein [Lachnospiraceae bacterium]
MERFVMIDEISDGQLYGRDDPVRLDANGCHGCSFCCENMCDTIVLDPWDIFHLSACLGKNFAALLTEGYIEIGLHDLLTLPNIRDAGEGCGFLTKEKRCGIHASRPGICRLFPLGRYYHDDGFSYILQTGECRVEERSKKRIRDWLEIEDLERYEDYVLRWHDLIRTWREFMKEDNPVEAKRKLNIMLLRMFYEKEYETDKDFYEQFDARLQAWQNL